MKLKEQIANLFTLMNLVCGVIGIMFLWRGDLTTACMLIFCGALFDALDGLVARALKITSDIGKQLDSLSDMVTFGVMPGLIAYFILKKNASPFPILSATELIPVFIPVFSAIRLAKFNIDARQSKDFIGMPTPANALLWASLGVISDQGQGLFGIGRNLANVLSGEIQQLLLNQALVMGGIVFASLMLVSPIHIMGFKFDGLSWKGNEIKFALMIISVSLILFFGITGIPVIIILYPLFSILNRTFKKHEV